MAFEESKNLVSGIESRESVCGSEPCIARTRIPVWVLVQYRQRGVSNLDILRLYPMLALSDLENAWRYAEKHRDEIEGQIRANEGA
jgi:uncharacterized protein (DUF433 family)